jgi:uptake hydrogenase large subunit
VVPPLEQTSEEALEHRLTGPDRDAFIAQPTWDGQPHETGALPREVHRPLIADLTRRHGNGLMTRLAARLSELARLPARIAAALNGLDPDLAPPLAMPKGTSAGIGQIEAARGRLIHRIEIDSGQVVGYQILAPTEWNFHPDGVLVRGLQGLPAGTELHTLVALAIEAVDPCVGYRIQTSS